MGNSEHDRAEENRLAIALIDASTNCERDGAAATLTLRSGALIVGKLERPSPGGATAHVRHDGGGWSTVRVEEIAAVTSKHYGGAGWPA